MKDPGLERADLERLSILKEVIECALRVLLRDVVDRSEVILDQLDAMSDADGKVWRDELRKWATEGGNGDNGGEEMSGGRNEPWFKAVLRYHKEMKAHSFQYLTRKGWYIVRARAEASMKGHDRRKQRAFDARSGEMIRMSVCFYTPRDLEPLRRGPLDDACDALSPDPRSCWVEVQDRIDDDGLERLGIHSDEGKGRGGLVKEGMDGRRGDAGCREV